jgi:hypothetical protein
LFRKTEGKRLLERPRRRWEDNVRIYLGEIGWEFVNWLYLSLAQEMTSYCEHCIKGEFLD